jgi:hypothetical protein
MSIKKLINNKNIFTIHHIHIVPQARVRALMETQLKYDTVIIFTRPNRLL